MESLYVTQNNDHITEVVAEGEIVVYEFHHSSGVVKHTFIKREIPARIDGEIYYDLTSLLPYGGPIIMECSKEDKWELVDEFERDFQVYCLKNNIICESALFDPLFSNVIDFVCYYEMEYMEKYIALISTTTINFNRKSKFLINNEGRFLNYSQEFRFLNKEVDYYITDKIMLGKKIWNSKVYIKICLATQIGPDGDYFPAYRSNEKNY